MSNIYCDYKKNKYKAKLRDQKLLITSKRKEEEFVHYVDVLGNEHDDLFMKELNVEEVDLLYEEYIFIKYKGLFFQLFSGIINKSSIDNNLFMIWTESEEIADKYQFEKKEQFVFTKDINREDIESIKIVKRPISVFKDKPSQEEILEDKFLEKWFEAL